MIQLEITAHGYHTVEVEEELVKHLLDADGEEFDPDAVDDLPMAINRFSATEAYAAIDAAVDFGAVIREMDYEVSEMDLITKEPSDV
jgi:hypothetical protein